MGDYPDFEAGLEFLSLNGKLKYTVQLGFSRDKKSFEALIFNSDPTKYVHITGIDSGELKPFAEYAIKHPCWIDHVEHEHPGEDIDLDELVKEDKIPLKPANNELVLGRDINPAFEPFLEVEPINNSTEYIRLQNKRMLDYLSLLRQIGAKYCNNNNALIMWIKRNPSVLRAEHPLKKPSYGPVLYGNLRYCTHNNGHLWDMLDDHYVRKFYIINQEEAPELVRYLKKTIGEVCPECKKLGR